MEVKQHFTFIPSSNCYENAGKLRSKYFWLIKWLQACRVTKMKSTIDNFPENNLKLPCPAPAPDEAIQD